ncbi:MAG: hypothetical protein J6386_03685 [Candidatus Synoicihabitans palmerolidicus]|nr:hypothetical protein [Candidatus Synoicihabitans palmerolidicus]
MGVDLDGDGIGEPVRTHAKPNVGGTYPSTTPPDSDEFSSLQFGQQWQWHANPRPWWGFPNSGKGELRLFAMQLPITIRATGMCRICYCRSSPRPRSPRPRSLPSRP